MSTQPNATSPAESGGTDLAAHYRARVTRTTIVLIAVPTVVLGLIGLAVGFVLPGAALGLVAGAALPYWASRVSEQTVVATLGSHPADQADHARLLNLVDGLCLVSGASHPDVRVVESEALVALAVHESGSPGTIVVSSGLASRMGRVEMEAVLAHLVSRIRSGEIALATYVVALGMELSRLGLGAVGARVRRATLEESAILAADLAACRTTRYPPALVSALEQVSSSAPADPGIPVVTAPLWFAIPALGGATTGGSPVPIVDAFQPPLADRIAIGKDI
ncbi:MAG: hypothetical protein ACKOQ7_00560 [Actinomycetota bacterium]